MQITEEYLCGLLSMHICFGDDKFLVPGIICSLEALLSCFATLTKEWRREPDAKCGHLLRALCTVL